jgi:hypothetical protein
MVQRPPEVGAFEFVILSTLRAAQLLRGCIPTISGDHRPAVTAQLEVAAGHVVNTWMNPAAAPSTDAQQLMDVPATQA